MLVAEGLNTIARPIIPLMRSPVIISIETFMIASLLIIGSLSLVPSSMAADPDPELVPEPWVHETHEFNVQGDTDPAHGQGFWANEKWSIEVKHGDVMTLIMARNITQDDNITDDVDYTMNIHYKIGGTLYIAQFMIMQVAFVIGGVTINVPLKTCDGFKLAYSPIKYNGTVPTMDCNITFENIKVYSTATKNSSFNLTLLHHIAGNWNDTDIKVEALFDFNHTRFISTSNDSEFGAGEPFAAEVHYMMMLSDPNTFATSGAIIPTGHTNTSMEYNLTFNGSPLIVSELKMKKNFLAYNATGLRSMIGYSSIAFGPQSFVTHGFSNLTYKDTMSIKSDPEIIVNHDRVTENSQDQNPGQTTPQWGLIATIGIVAAIGIVAVFVIKRRKNKLEKGGG